MICPTCEGQGLIFFPFVKRGKMLPCHRCDGLKEVPDEMKEWMAHGETLKDRRIEKRITLRKAAKFLKMDVCELSDMEIGKIKPDLNIQYYCIKVIVK